ncbi:hypothetical protein [Pseudoroseicyclus aestuarii]|uniref:Uncharacterized protein n=1 Tax=Pseudoroseicyclus aestuarii TaxID=1795041 RepID=A0A318SVQ6_9RHOB|nr:hypothetical protein [Pseudoroseicyclus aestuarii]PYE85991.1 hypothetical protein DFP88_101666 [Pseudoroseicyclus aestuarii]
MTYRFRVLALAAGLLPAAPQAQEVNNLWLMWERSGLSSPSCADPATGACDGDSQFRSHFLMQVPGDEALDLFRFLSPRAQRYGTADLVHSALPICMDRLNEAPDEGDPEMATAIETLEGLGGVHADFRGVRGPAGYPSDFGGDAQRAVERILSEAGVPLVSEEELAAIPGRPELSLRFSPEVVGCRLWSVSLSLRQTVVLDRDRSKALTTTTWSSSAGQSEDDVDFGAGDAMRQVIEAFAQAWAEAQAADLLAEVEQTAD